MNNTHQKCLNVPISQTTADRFNNYIKLTGIDASYALEYAISRLTAKFWIDKKKKKKATINIAGRKTFCWVLGKVNNDDIDYYRVIIGSTIDMCKAEQIELFND